jgi:hypothetical protein
MKKGTSATAWCSLCAALLFLGASASGAEAQKPTELKTIEQQIAYLQGAFTEAVTMRDWQMLEMVAEGLKAAGLRGTELEVVILRGEVDAAVGLRSPVGQVVTWGLSCRAKAGDAKALEALRELAKTDPPQGAMPDADLWRKDPAAANAAMKAFQASFAALDKRDEALLCLALLKEPGLEPRLMECLAAKRPASPGFGVAFGRGDPLVEAVLLADPQTGWGKLTEFLNQQGEKASFDGQLRAWQGAMGLLPKNRARWAGAAPDNFTLEAQVLALLPKDADTQLLKPYISLLGRCPTDAFNQLNSLLSYGYALPKQEPGSEILAVLEGLKAKIAAEVPNRGYLVQLIDNILAQQKGIKAAQADPFTPHPVEPPKVPAEF